MAEYQLHCFAQSGNAYRAALMLNQHGASTVTRKALSKIGIPAPSRLARRLVSAPCPQNESRMPRSLIGASSCHCLGGRLASKEAEWFDFVQFADGISAAADDWASGHKDAPSAGAPSCDQARRRYFCVVWRCRSQTPRADNRGNSSSKCRRWSAPRQEDKGCAKNL